MIITRKWLEEIKPCPEAIVYFDKQKLELTGIDWIKKLMAENRLDWANWLITRLMKRKQYIAYAIFASEQVIDIFEAEYPNDDRPRKAIEAAKKCLEEDTEKNRNATNAAANATYAATYAAAYAAKKEMQIKILNYGMLEMLNKGEKL